VTDEENKAENILYWLQLNVRIKAHKLGIHLQCVTFSRPKK
jgi:hypothetical protein